MWRPIRLAGLLGFVRKCNVESVQVLGTGMTPGLHHTAEKLGVPIVVWHYAPCVDNPEMKEWSRFVLATRFSQGYACCARGKQAAVVIRRDRDYTALLPPKDTPVPMSWTEETPTFVMNLSGAGRDLGTKTPSDSEAPRATLGSQL